MSEIINLTSIQDDREKYGMYQQALEHFMYYKKNDDTKKFHVSGVNTPKDINKVNRVNNDEDTNEIINLTSIQDDREKYGMYQQALKRFMYYKKYYDTKKIHVSGVNTPGDINEVNRVNNDEDTYEENCNESIVNRVPQKLQFKAKMLLQRLHDFGDVTWDDRGKNTIDSSTVEGENIVDLINDAVRNRKQPLSNGSGQWFAQAFRKANIPREFIVNDKIWQLVSSPQSDDEETQQSDSEKTNEKPSSNHPQGS